MNPWWRSYQRCPSVGTSMPASSWSPIMERTPSVNDSAKSASRIATRKSRSRTSNRFHVGLGYEPTCVVGNRCPTMSLRFRATPPSSVAGAGIHRGSARFRVAGPWFTRMVRLPDRIEGDGLVLRRWRAEDAELLHEAVVDSVEHLRPWMPWIADEPMSVEQRRALIEGWERDWEGGGDVVLAIVRDGIVAGGSGLHRRRGPDVLEIGYWLRPGFVGRGIVTTAARLLTTAAFAVDGIERVEIWHEVG